MIKAFRRNKSEILPLIKPVSKLLTLGFLLLLVVVSIQLSIPFFIGKFVDGEFIPKNLTSLILLASILLIIALAYCGANALRFYMFDLAGNKIVMSLRKKLFNNLIKQEIGFFDSQKVGSLTSRISTDVESLRNTLTIEVAFFIRTSITAIAGIFLLISLSWTLTLVLLILFPATVYLGKKYGALAHESAKIYHNELAENLDIAQESLTNVRQVHAFNKIPQIIEKYAKGIFKAQYAATNQTQVQAWFQASHNFLNYFVVIVLVAIGGYQVVQGRMTIGEITSFILYTNIASGGLIGILEVWNNWKRAQGGSEKLFDLLNREPKKPKTDNQFILTHTEGKIEFKDVSFSYPQRPHETALRQINFSANAGEVVALVGASGAGKSTIASLILGHYQTQKGQILIDGKQHNSININSLRDSIAVVEQEPKLFSGSLLDNIKLGAIDDNVTQETVIEAAKQANAHQFISQFENGYHTEAGPNGVQLSGGQKQRIAIARAILRAPTILILDEATSALDSESELLVQQALADLMKGRTTLVIAHRLSTIISADKILVLEKGEIVEIGNHAELLEITDGHYKKLIENQLSELAA